MTDTTGTDTKNQGGRPSIYTDELAATICRRMADRPMDRYIRVYRPRILDLSGRNYLWTSQTGKPLKNGGVYAAIARRTRDAFGLSYGPQDFRVSAATTIAISDPANIHTASLVLGHIYEGTTEKWYNRARTIDASRRYQVHLDALRKRLGRDT